jgi:hypothetical protein
MYAMHALVAKQRLCYVYKEGHRSEPPPPRGGGGFAYVICLRMAVFLLAVVLLSGAQ